MTTATDVEEVDAEARKLPEEIKPNTLVAYHGGGYDGCFWEWNYCFFDEDKQFHDVGSSGRNAIKSLEDFFEHWDGWKWQIEQDKKEEARCPKYYHATSRDDEICLTYMDDSEDVTAFCNAFPVAHAIGAATWFAQNGYTFAIQGNCSCCGELFDVHRGQAEGAHGCGGIAIAYRDLICPECVEKGTCAHCNEYVGEEDIAKDPEDEEEVHESHYCKWCLEEHKDEYD